MDARLSALTVMVVAAVGAGGCGTPQEPASGQPAILRTDPEAGASDVLLSQRIIVVFSEPIDPATATPARVQLRRRGLRLPATIRFSADRLEMELVPDEGLAPASSYTLIVSADLANKTGARLEQGVQVDFTTGISSWNLSAGQYELSALIKRFDPGWGIDFTGYRYTALITIERSSPTFSGTFKDMWLVGPIGDSLSIARSGSVTPNNGALDLVRPEAEKGSRFTLTLYPSEVASQSIKGAWACCGHIWGSFTAERK